MGDDRVTEVLKSAILLEKRGQAFYSRVAEQARSAAVREFFETMAREEVAHVRILSDQFKAYQRDQRFETLAKDDKDEDDGPSVPAAVLSDEIKRQIAAADYEAAAIAAAMGMEKNAVDIYSRRAKEADDPNERALYNWLADWETRHLEALSELNRQITEAIWHDNSFWPF